MLQPKRTKIRKAFKGRIHGASKGNTALHFGSYGLKALEPERITARQIEAARRAITRQVLARPADGWQQRLRAAEADAARAATAQWDGFLARAHAAPAHARTDVQRAVVGGGLRPAS